MIRFEHTVFALPFAYTGAFLAGRGRVPLEKFFWITLAMVAARTAGMSLNRLIDRELDAVNPRTANRHLPRGILQPGTVWLIVLVSLALFLLASARLNTLCLALSPAALLLLLTYSYLKRFTWLCHLGLGMVLACAPVGGWMAVAGRLDPTPVALGLAVVFWLAGFDVLYGCLDYEFDRQFGLFSIPRRFGLTRALWISAFFHVLTFAFLALTGILGSLGWPFDVGLLLVALLLIYQHAVVSPHDFSRMNQAFFHANAVISLLVFASTMASLWIGP